MCSATPHAFSTGVSAVRVQDFGGRERIWPLGQKCPLESLQISQRQRLMSVGNASECCESVGIPFTFQRLAKHRRQAQNTVVNALPLEAVSAAGAIVVVGASAGALLWMNQDKLRSISSAKIKCEACDGSGLCSVCKGEGFQLKNLSPQAVERARANAENAATRYTAGLAKKWNYCPNCSGSRNCPACDGTGRLGNTQPGS